MSNKTDKELLELAAKASGYQLQRMCDPVESGCVGSEFFHMNGRYWNPLADDGDAFRLAVKLEIDINHYMHSVEVLAYYDGDPLDMISQDAADCRYAATRLAIVMTAAAIGEQL